MWPAWAARYHHQQDRAAAFHGRETARPEFQPPYFPPPFPQQPAGEVRTPAAPSGWCAEMLGGHNCDPYTASLHCFQPGQNQFTAAGLGLGCEAGRREMWRGEAGQDCLPFHHQLDQQQITTAGFMPDTVQFSIKKELGRLHRFLLLPTVVFSVKCAGCGRGTSPASWRPPPPTSSAPCRAASPSSPPPPSTRHVLPGLPPPHCCCCRSRWARCSGGSPRPSVSTRRCWAACCAGEWSVSLSSSHKKNQGKV